MIVSCDDFVLCHSSMLTVVFGTDKLVFSPREFFRWEDLIALATQTRQGCNSEGFTSVVRPSVVPFISINPLWPVISILCLTFSHPGFLPPSLPSSSSWSSANNSWDLVPVYTGHNDVLHVGAQTARDNRPLFHSEHTAHAHPVHIQKANCQGKQWTHSILDFCLERVCSSPRSLDRFRPQGIVP